MNLFCLSAKLAFSLLFVCFSHYANHQDQEPFIFKITEHKEKPEQNKRRKTRSKSKRKRVKERKEHEE